MTVKTNGEYTLTDYIAVNKHLEWASAWRREFHYLSTLDNKYGCTEGEQKVDKVTWTGLVCVAEIIGLKPIGRNPAN
ncbi:MAG: hypothetical protein A2Z14_08605 [Chloroflexi bacterium RBG_16_48_8]|nr:MAG: hypothetical protein A2Z14_08605 [Chloroflexi bacterium RBG_16_48_8]